MYIIELPLRKNYVLFSSKLVKTVFGRVIYLLWSEIIQETILQSGSYTPSDGIWGPKSLQQHQQKTFPCFRKSTADMCSISQGPRDGGLCQRSRINVNNV